MKRDYGLDLSKIVAMCLVAYAHFVVVGSFEENRYASINGNSALPLIPSETHSMWKVEKFFLECFGIELGIVAVVIFMIIFGMNLPSMQKRHKASNLFIYYYLKIFPTLLFSALIVIVIEKCIQNTNLSFGYFLSRLCLKFPAPDVLWFMDIIFIMLLVTCCISKFTVRNIFVLYFMCLLSAVIIRVFPDLTLWLMWLLKYFSVIGIILLGCLWSTTKDLSLSDRIVYLFFALSFVILIFNICNPLPSVTYSRLQTYLAAFFVILLCRALLTLSTKSFFIRTEICLPFYLLHVCVGGNTMFLIKKFVSSSYVIVLAAFIASICAAIFVTEMSFYTKLIIKKFLKGRYVDKIYKA